MINIIRLASAFVILISCISCSIKYVAVPIEMPSLEYIPILTNKELACLSQYTYRKISILQINSDKNTRLLTASIKSTWLDNE